MRRLDLQHGPVTVLGDPHLGRRFLDGVPLHRRGHREEWMMKDFKDSLKSPIGEIHICVGDLFHTPFIPYDILHKVYTAYASASMDNRRTEYVILQGNHDVYRDGNLSGFNILAYLMKDNPNVKVVTQPYHDPHQGILYVPFMPNTTAAEVWERAKALANNWPLQAIVGHWDTEGAGDNIIPLAEVTSIPGVTIINGHVHLPSKQEFPNGVTLVNTGSMQPMAHDQDPERRIYVVGTWEELKDQDLYNKCLRVVIQKDYTELPVVDCLELKVIRKGAEDNHQQQLEVDFDVFDFQTLFREEMKTAAIPDAIVNTLMTAYQKLDN